MHNKCTKVTKGVDIRYINAIFSPTQSDNRIIAEDEKHIYRKIVMQQLAIYVVVAIIADIAGKEIVTICMFLGIIIMVVMQVPCLIGGGNWGIIVTCKQF